jgi:hypothetical protein
MGGDAHGVRRVAGLLAVAALAVASWVGGRWGATPGRPPVRSAVVAASSVPVQVVVSVQVPIHVEVPAPAPLAEAARVRHAEFGEVVPTPAARAMADWAVARRDNGARPLGQIREDEKTTPAGRFDTTPGRNLAGEAVVWIDYADAISMHRVRKVAASERRLERLATPTPDDNRISFGCINVPVAFFDAQVAPTFGGRAGVAYVIPETRTIAQEFEPAAGASQGVATARDGPAVTGATVDR